MNRSSERDLEESAAYQRAPGGLIVVPNLLAGELDRLRKLAREEAALELPATAAVTPESEAVPSKVRRPRGTEVLYDAALTDEMLDQIKKGRHGRGERADLVKQTLGLLTEKGPYRRLARPGPNWRAHMAEMRAQFPNGKELFDYLAGEFQLAEHAGKPLSLSPIGLVGDPGVGKSMLATAIADLLRSPMTRVQVEISGHAAALVGTELHWSSAGPGLLFQALGRSDFINPILLLDEIEKAPKRDDHPNLHKVLFSLLEPASARNFQDASLPGIALDASHVRWIATANSLEGVPLAIQSRMRFFNVPPLTPAQAKTVLGLVDARLRQELKLKGFQVLPASVQERLVKESPRRMGLILRSMYGSAIVRGDGRVLDADWPKAVNPPRTGPTGNVSSTETNLDLFTLTDLAAMRAIALLYHMQALRKQTLEMMGGPRVLH